MVQFLLLALLGTVAKIACKLVVDLTASGESATLGSRLLAKGSKLFFANADEEVSHSKFVCGCRLTRPSNISE